MKNSPIYFTFAALILLSSNLSSQTASTHTPTHAPAHTQATHRPSTASTEPPLPKSIPPAKGIPKSLYALRYIDITPGTGAAAVPGWAYTVHYTGWLYDGTKFDSSVDRGSPFEFVQGQHRVIIGWDTAFDGMQVGGKRRLFIPWQLAYGERGHPPTIPAKANLIFDIELIDQRNPLAPPPAAPATSTPPAGSATPPDNGTNSGEQPKAKPE
jgi:peptidylprolyl isomerase